MLKFKKHLALFLFAASSAASAAYAFPTDPHGMCVRYCLSNYNRCMHNTGGELCWEQFEQCRDHCPE